MLRQLSLRVARIVQIRYNKKRELTFHCQFSLLTTAERRGFEPRKPFRGLHAFQACQFNHSCIFPWLSGAKIE